MSNKIIFFNTGWMDFYRGLNNDKIIGGGKHVVKTGWGGEMANFEPYRDNYYGYVQPKINRGASPASSTIRLENLGAGKEDEKIEGVTVVWTATDPRRGGTYIVGWYNSATVYRHAQQPPRGSGRSYKAETLVYFTKAKTEDSVLLPVDARNMRVYRQLKTWMGQSNVWFAEENPLFVQQVRDYIFSGLLPTLTPTESKAGGKPRQPDPLKRLEVEKSAVLYVTEHYRKLGYTVESFEKDNLGWDLTATADNIKLKLEVKGLSGSAITTELTPNEYENMLNDKTFYRICIVTNALIKPELSIFSYSISFGRWLNEKGIPLECKIVKSARIWV